MDKKEKKVNKTKWILAQKRELAAHELVTLAKKEGIKLSAAQIYVARSVAKKRAAAAQTLPAVGTKKAAVTSPHQERANGKLRLLPTAKAPDLARQFVQLAVRVGIDNSQAWLDELRTADL